MVYSSSDAYDEYEKELQTLRRERDELLKTVQDQNATLKTLYLANDIEQATRKSQERSLQKLSDERDEYKKLWEHEQDLRIRTEDESGVVVKGSPTAKPIEGKVQVMTKALTIIATAPESKLWTNDMYRCAIKMTETARKALRDVAKWRTQTRSR